MTKSGNTDRYARVVKTHPWSELGLPISRDCFIPPPALPAGGGDQKRHHLTQSSVAPLQMGAVVILLFLSYLEFHHQN